MNYKKYSFYLKDKTINTNYYFKLQKELNVFSTQDNLKRFITGKIRLLSNEYELTPNIKWRSTKTEIEYKNETILLSDKFITASKFDYIYYIPYLISLELFNICSQQPLYKFKFDDWLNFFSSSFFDLNITTQKTNIKLIKESHFPSEIIRHPMYQSIDTSKVKTFSNSKIDCFLSEMDCSNNLLFFLKFKSRNYLFLLTK